MSGNNNFHLLFELAADSMFIIDSDGFIREVNQAGSKLFGYTKTELLGRHVARLIAPEFGATLNTRLGKAQNQEYLMYESAMVHKDDSVIPIEICLKAIDWDGGRAFYGIVRDIGDRKRAQEALKKSETRFRQTLDILVEGCMILDFDWTYLYVNETAARHGQSKADSLIGRTMLEAYPGVEASPIFAHYKRCMEERVPQQFEESFTFANGITSWYAFSVQPVPEGIFVLSSDITDRKRAEGLLQFHAEILTTVAEGIFLVRPSDGTILYANPKFERMFGYETDELIGKNVSVLNAPAKTSAEAVANAINMQLAITGEWNGEILNIRKDGATFWCSVSIVTINHPELGRIWVAAHHDISERKLSHTALEHALKFSNNMISSMQDGFSVLDENGCAVNANEALCRMTGFSREELVGLKAPFPYWPPEEYENIQAAFEKTLKGEVSSFELTFMRKNGERFPAMVSPSPVKDNHDGNLGFVATVRDITESKKFEALEKYHSKIISGASDGFWATDLNGTLLEANQAYADMSGYSINELLQLHVSQLDAIHDSEQTKARIEKLIREGRDLFETQHRHKDGHLFDVEVSVNYMPDQKQFFAFLRNISERKRDKEMIIASERRLNEAQHLAHIGSWTLDLLNGELVWSDEIFDLFEIDPRQFSATYEAFLDAIHPEDREKVNLAYSNSLVSRVPYSIRHRLLMSDRRIKWVHERCQTDFDPMGKPLRSHGTVQDITEQVRTESELSIAAIAFETQESLMITDTNGVILRVNKAFTETTGYTADEVVGQTPRLLRSGRHNEDFYRDMWESISRTGSWRGEIWDRRKNGEIYPKWLAINAVKRNDGVVTHYVGSHIDITERKAAEERLIEIGIQKKRADLLSQQFGDLLKNSFNEIYMIDANSLCILQVSEGAKRNLGYSDEELSRLTLLDLNPEFAQNNLGELIASFRSRKDELLLFESVHHRRDGTTYPVEVRLQLMKTDPPYFMVVVQDLTERKHSHRQISNLAAHIQSIREEEKASMAREVHDNLGSTLSALKMDVYWLADELSAIKEATPLLEHVDSMSKLLDNAVSVTRQVISDLRPTILDDLGLHAALEWKAGEFQKRTGIRCRVDYVESEGSEERLRKIQSINLFRIVQEALTNVVRHSGATMVEIELQLTDETVILAIIDDGCGMREGHIVRSTSYGMLGMRERVVQLNGRIDFFNLPDGGFSVTVVLPLLTNPQEQEEA